MESRQRCNVSNKNLKTKYIKWTLGLEQHTPNYIVLDGTKMNYIRVDSGGLVYEEKARSRVLKSN